MRRLLWVGDAVVATGFAKSTHKVLEVLRQTWDVHVIGINYNGDPHPYPYPIYPAIVGGDGMGMRRMAQLATELRPDLVIVQNDPWNIPGYLDRTGNAPLVAVMPVDGRNCRGTALNGLTGAIFWTEFGLVEARNGGYRGPAAVIPLGVDTSLFTPGDRLAARKRIGLGERFLDGFVVGNVNRNQPRKRLDLTISYFAEWVRLHNIEDAYLFLHVAPTGDPGYDVSQLAEYYGLTSRLILSEPPIGPGVREDLLVEAYRAMDVQVTTTQGEGWGLCTMEGMACGIPQIVPAWSALAEWVPETVACQVPCFETCVTPNGINAIGAVPSRPQFIKALNWVYANRGEAATMAGRALSHVRQPQYEWSTIGSNFALALEHLLQQKVLAGPNG